MNRTLIAACMVLLVFFALGVLVLQGVILPTAAQQSLEMFPEVDFLYAPLLYSLEFVLLLADVIIVCLWMLLSRIWAGTIFTPSSFGLVNVIVSCFALAAAVFVALLFVFLFGIRAGGPGVVLGLLAGAGGALFAALVLLVMRGLLQTATQQQAYLAEVV
jgi:hypothetical protein